MFCSKFKKVINFNITQNHFKSLLFLGFSVTFLLEYFMIFPQASYINFLQKIILIFLLLSFLIQYESKLDSKYISTMANTSFGVYFLHGYVLIIAWTISNYISKNFTSIEPSLIQGNIFIFMATCISIILICILAIYLIKKLIGSKSCLLIGYNK